MVEPKWLEQAYIVLDLSSDLSETVISDSTRSQSSIDVKAIPYRSFIAEKPNHTSYFQPILDTLEVKPSSFDYRYGGLITEGKSDFYYIKFCCSVLKVESCPIFPSTGSGTMGALVSLHRGWGLPVRILFDKDKGGNDGKKKLKRENSVLDDETITVGDIMDGANVIEDLFSDSDLAKLVSQDSKNPKIELLRTIQEHLAAGTIPKIDSTTRSRMKKLIKGINDFMSKHE